MQIIDNYELQTLRMCIQTYFNLYGVMPGTREMIEWLGESHTKTILMYMSNMQTGKAA